MSFCCLEWWRHCRANLRERGVELSFVWRRALLPSTFLFLRFCFFSANSELPSSIHLRGGGPQIPLADPYLSHWHNFGACTSSKLHSWTLSYERACLDCQKIWFKDFGFVFIFVHPIFKSLKILLAERSSSFWTQGHLQFLFLLDNVLAFVCLPCFSYLLFLLTARRVCVWGGAVCTQVTCQSYDNESIPSCFVSYFGQEKSPILAF